MPLRARGSHPLARVFFLASQVEVRRLAWALPSIELATEAQARASHQVGVACGGWQPAARDSTSLVILAQDDQ